MTEVAFQINDLLKLKHELKELLEDKSYEAFEQKEKELAKSIRYFFEENTKESMTEFIPELKELEESINHLQDMASRARQDLKNKSLIQKRNKSKLNAYK